MDYKAAAPAVEVIGETPWQRANCAAIVRRKSLNSPRRYRLLRRICPGRQPRRLPAHQQRKSNQHLRTQPRGLRLLKSLFPAHRLYWCHTGRPRASPFPPSYWIYRATRASCRTREQWSGIRRFRRLRGCTRGCTGVRHTGNPCSRPRIIVPMTSGIPFNSIAREAFCPVRSSHLTAEKGRP